MENQSVQRLRRVIAALAFCTSAFVSDAKSLDITLSFNQADNVSPTFDPAGGFGGGLPPQGLTSLLLHVVDFYEDVFESPHDLTINYWYEDLDGDTLGDHSLVSQSGGLETEANLRIDTRHGSGGAERNWFVDNTPGDDSEFNMSQSFWSDLSSSERTDYFNFGSGIPDKFEIGFSGSASILDAAWGNYDMLTVLFHEVGHALGMSAAADATVAETNGDFDYDFDPDWVIGKSLAAETANNVGDDNANIAHLENPDSLMSPSVSFNNRKLPSHTDLFAMAGASNYTDLDVPRREMYRGGNWHTHSNWSGDVDPEADDDAYLRHGGTTRVSSSSGFANSVTVDDGTTLQVLDRHLSLSDDLNIAQTQTGEVQVTGASADLTVDGFVNVGVHGDGELLVQNGGAVNIGGNLRIGSDSILSNGVVTVRDNSSISTGSFDLQIGFVGEGQLNVQDSAAVFAADDIIVASDANANGTVNITGGSLRSGNSGQTNRDLVVGFDGVGTFNQSGGVTTVNGEVAIARNQFSSGQISVSGSGTQFLATQAMSVGYSSNGTLSVSNQGSVSTDGQMYVGRANEGAGTVTVSGTGSLLTVNSQAFVGSAGNGTLAVTGGARFNMNSQIYVGRTATGVGEVTIDGPGSIMDGSSLVSVGDSGNGTLNITNGGALDAASNLRIGTVGAGSVGVVNVSENSSITTANFDMQVGFQGTGTLNVSDTATVDAAKHLVLGNSATGNGTINQSGGTINVGTVTSGDLVVGWGGTGDYTMTGGMLTTTRQLYVGRGANATGTVDLTGGNTQVEIGRSAYIGHSGYGQLNITNGAHFETQGVEPNGVQIAREPDSTGEMNISGGGTTMHSSGHWYVGYQGTLGTANVSDGAVVTTDSFVRVGLSEPGTGVLTIAGAGSMLAANDDVVVGDFGTGTLNMTGGSQLTTTQNLVLGERGENSNGTATISGSSAVASTVSTIVGKVGTGMMTVENAAQLTIGGGLEIGQQSTGVGTFTQAGGAVNVAGDVRVSVSVGSAGTATLTGGALMAQNLLIKPFNTDAAANGSLSINGNANAYFTGDVSLSNSSTLSIADTGTLNADGNLNLNSASVNVTGGALDVGADMNIGPSGVTSIMGGTVEVNGVAVPTGTGELRIDAGGLRADVIDTSQGIFTYNGGGVETRQFVGDLTHTNGIFKANQFDGVLNVEEGTLVISDVPTEDPIGAMLINGDLDVAKGPLLFDLAGTSAGMFDTLHATGSITLDSMLSRLSIATLDGFAVSVGDQYDLITADGGITGEFERLRTVNTTFNGFVEFEMVYITNSISLLVVPALDGDFNADGDVDGKDFLEWQRNPSIGDLGDWQTNHGQTLPPSVSASTAVPEPGSFASFLVQCFIFCSVAGRSTR